MSVARYASTVVLLRPDDDGSFEILLTRRPEAMKFLGGFYVFPGGAVHKNDYSEKMLQRCRGLDNDDAQKILGLRREPEVAIGHWVAGVRELFEEVGILLCVSESGAEVEVSSSGARKELEPDRRAIVRGDLAFGSFLEQAGLYCDLSGLTYFFHRVTPEIYAMRFDTRFYLAVLPAGQIPLERSEEVTHSLWIKPREMKARLSRHDFPILPPTTTVLEDLGAIDSWDELRRSFRLP